MLMLILSSHVPEFEAECFEEAATPNAKEQNHAEKDYGIQAGEISPGPIDALLDVQPNGKLVQGESGGNAVEQRHQTARQQRGRLFARPYFDQPAKPHHEQK